MPPFERSASGAILLEKWGSESPDPTHQSGRQKSPLEHQIPHQYKQKTQVRTKAKQETIEDVQNRIKAEVDAARFKIAAAEAQNENERMKKLLS